MYERYERWQIETGEYRERLLTVAQASSGYVGAELRPETHEELTAEVRRLITQKPSRLTSAGPRSGGAGIQVTTTDRDLLTTDDPTGMLGARFPVTVQYGEPAVAI